MKDNATHEAKFMAIHWKLIVQLRGQANCWKCFGIGSKSVNGLRKFCTECGGSGKGK